jgi:hypothetical protein
MQVLLPEGEGGYRYSCSDPITGQAAWYDLRVSVRKAAPEEAELSDPQFTVLGKPPGLPQVPDRLRYGASFHKRTGDGRGTGGGS